MAIEIINKNFEAVKTGKGWGKHSPVSGNSKVAGNSNVVLLPTLLLADRLNLNALPTSSSLIM